MYDNNESDKTKQVVVNGMGSPVRISIESAVSQKTQRPYEFLQISLGEWDFRQYFQSPLERKEAQRVLDQINKGNATFN